jgi:hypothetical protein
MRLLFSATLALLLFGCASNYRLSNYVRTDGAPVNESQEQATLAQCDGEAAIASTNANSPMMVDNVRTNVTNACMARNGYIRAQ